MSVHRWFGIASKFCKIFTYTSSSGKVTFLFVVLSEGIMLNVIQSV